MNCVPARQVPCDIPSEVDYESDFGPSEHEAWDAEYASNVNASFCCDYFNNSTDEKDKAKNDLSKLSLPSDFLEEFEKMTPVERQFILDELAERPELWDEEEAMFYEY